MPLYEYECSPCEIILELLRPISRMDDEAICPECQGLAQRQLSVFTSFTKSANGKIGSVAGGGGCGGGGCGGGCACARSA